MTKRCIVAGGRDFKPDLPHCTALKAIFDQYAVTEVISGMARGADMFGRKVALESGLTVKEFPADWDKHGRAAGIIRNAQMADYASEVPDSICVLFPGGRGTANMKRTALRKGLHVIDMTAFCEHNKI